MKLIIFETSGSHNEILTTNYSEQEIIMAHKNKVHLNAWSPTKAGQIKINKLDLQNNYLDFNWVPQKQVRKNIIQKKALARR